MKQAADNRQTNSATEATKAQRTFVVKVGTRTLTQGGDALDKAYMTDLVRQLATLRRAGHRVVLVTSGAIHCGVHGVGVPRPGTVPQQQAAAAVGQGLLIHMYASLFRRRRLAVAQILLTRDDFADRRRYLNARNTLNELFDWGAVPIVNENDTVAVDEIRVGENDTLAALVATLVNADLLVLLSDVDGFYLPGRNVPVACIDEITPEIEQAAGASRFAGGTGGMITKLDAARIATASGVPMRIVNGSRPNAILDVAAGAQTGTLFTVAQTLNARKRWIAFGRRSCGMIQVNEGAKRNIVAHGKSLLPVGIVSISGRFDRGDLVTLIDESGQSFARGLVNYPADELVQLCGRKTREIASILGYRDSDEAVHRDNLVLDVNGNAKSHPSSDGTRKRMK